MKESSNTFLFFVLSVLNNLNLKGLRRFSIFLSKKFIHAPTETYILKLLHGFKLQISPHKDNGIDRALHFFGTYERGTLHFMKKYLKDNQTFVDLGANIGVHAMFASKLVGQEGRVIAFEPSANTRKILLENVQLNHCINIEVLSYAIGNSEEYVVLYKAANETKGEVSLLEPVNFNTQTAQTEIVSLSKLDSVLNNERVDMLKIDIEGFELKALKGAHHLIKQKPILIIECTSATENDFYNRVDLYNYLLSLNYTVFKLKGGKSRKGKLIRVTDVEDLPDQDNLFCFSYS